jgi:hypothetical protein
MLSGRWVSMRRRLVHPAGAMRDADHIFALTVGRRLSETLDVVVESESESSIVQSFCEGDMGLGFSWGEGGGL